MERKPKTDLSFLKIDRPKAEVISFRLSGEDAAKLAAMGRELKVGKSKMARVIVENFIEKHHPGDRRR